MNRYLIHRNVTASEIYYDFCDVNVMKTQMICIFVMSLRQFCRNVLYFH